MSHTRIWLLVSAALGLTACLDDLPEAGDEEDLVIGASRTAYTPDKMIRIANVNLFKGAFGEDSDGKVVDGRNFLWYLAHGKYVPDIFTVQNLKHSGGADSGFHDCADVARKLEKYLAPKAVQYDFYFPAVHGGSCVIYRSGRFERTDQALGLGVWKGPNCSERGMNSVGVRLRDKKFHNKTISVVSVHMPGECTTKNTRELREWADATHSDIKIIAGDFNTNTTGDFGSIPNMREVLEGSGYRVSTAGGADVWGPLDWLWRKGQSAVSNAKRIDYTEAMGAGYPSPTLRYSDHRGGFEDLTY